MGIGQLSPFWVIGWGGGGGSMQLEPWYCVERHLAWSHFQLQNLDWIGLDGMGWD